LFDAFGSGIVAGDTGIVFQNRGSAFSLDPKHPNALAPGKRPFHTIIPAMVFKDNQLFMSFGVMGGAIQPQGHVQVLVNLIDLKMACRKRSMRLGLESQTDENVLMEDELGSPVIEKLLQLGHVRGNTDWGLAFINGRRPGNYD
jgi:gamma-glutamyltranspeptidase/glutathione hydrolase